MVPEALASEVTLGIIEAYYRHSVSCAMVSEDLAKEKKSTVTAIEAILGLSIKYAVVPDNSAGGNVTGTIKMLTNPPTRTLPKASTTAVGRRSGVLMGVGIRYVKVEDCGLKMVDGCGQGVSGEGWWGWRRSLGRVGTSSFCVTMVLVQ